MKSNTFYGYCLLTCFSFNKRIFVHCFGEALELPKSFLDHPERKCNAAINTLVLNKGHLGPYSAYAEWLLLQCSALQLTIPGAGLGHFRTVALNEVEGRFLARAALDLRAPTDFFGSLCDFPKTLGGELLTALLGYLGQLSELYMKTVVTKVLIHITFAYEHIRRPSTRRTCLTCWGFRTAKPRPRRLCPPHTAIR
jgi:hypothetical protein